MIGQPVRIAIESSVKIGSRTRANASPSTQMVCATSGFAAVATASMSQVTAPRAVCQGPCRRSLGDVRTHRRDNRHRLPTRAIGGVESANARHPGVCRLRRGESRQRPPRVLSVPAPRGRMFITGHRQHDDIATDLGHERLAAPAQRQVCRRDQHVQSRSCVHCRSLPNAS